MDCSRNSLKLVLSGYYGFKNSGDEAVLQSILLALQAEGDKQGIRIEPTVLSIDPAGTAEMYNVTANHRMKPMEVLSTIRTCDGLISGGGSLLQDATGGMTIPYYLGILKLAQWLGKPTFIYSQGIGPVYRKMMFPLIRRTFEKCRYVSVRDVESAQLLQQMGFSSERVEVVPDPVMGLPLRQKTQEAKDTNVGFDSLELISTVGHRPVIGVSVRFWNEDRSELEQLARCLKIIIQHRDVDIRFLPFHLPSDVEASQEVIRRIPDSNGGETSAKLHIIEDVVHPQEMLAQVSECDLLIGMRLHSLIYAASQDVPMLGISYDPKIDQFLQRLDMKAAATTKQFDVDKVANEVLLLVDEQPGAWAARKRALIDKLKDEAHHPAEQIVSFFRNRQNKDRYKG